MMSLTRQANATGKVLDIVPGGAASAVCVNGGKIDLSIPGDAQEYFVSPAADKIYAYAGNTLTFEFNDGRNISHETLRILDSKSLQIGFGGTTMHHADSGQTKDTMIMGLGIQSNAFIICEDADGSGFDFAHDTQSDPTIWLHSGTQSTTEWLSFMHNKTDGLMESGAGHLRLTAASDKGVVCDSPLMIAEAAAAASDTAALGQVWVKNTAPNELWFTNDAGDDEWVAGNSAYGELYVTDGAGTQDLTTAGTAYKINQFTADGASLNTTPAHANDKITATYAGLYRVDLSMSFSGTASKWFEIAIYTGPSGSTTEETNLMCKRALGAGGDVGAVGISGLVTLAASDDVEVYVKSQSNGDDIVVEFANLTIQKIGS
jgi:hypothetical protein